MLNSFQARLSDLNEANVDITHEIAGHENLEDCYSIYRKQPDNIVLVYEAATSGVQCFLLFPGVEII